MPSVLSTCGPDCMVPAYCEPRVSEMIHPLDRTVILVMGRYPCGESGYQLRTDSVCVVHVRLDRRPDCVCVRHCTLK
jgi:hypothetical protein